MGFNERNIDGVSILDVHGRLTFTAGAELSRHVDNLSLRGALHIVIDLGDVSYIDSAGLGALVSAFTFVKHRGGSLKFLNPTARTRHLLQITGLAQLVATFESETAALASFDAGERKHASSSDAEPVAASVLALTSEEDRLRAPVS